MRTFWLFLVTSWFMGWCGMLDVSASVLVQFARTPALSPDGEKIAFSWHGDIWVVSVEGGIAQRLTSHPAYDSHPVWSRHGDKIAFTSQRHGNSDVFVMKATGGVPRRMTYHSLTDQALFWLPNDQGIVFHSNRDIDHTNRFLLYQVSPTGGMPKPYLPIHAADATMSPDGRYVVLVRGAVQGWRKRWNGPYHRHLWLYDTLTKTYTRLTKEGYTADFPAWISSKDIVFRSEQTGTLNVWRMNVETKKSIPLTHYRTGGVQHVHAGAEGKHVVFSRWKGVYGIHLETSLIQEIKIQASGDHSINRQVRKVATHGITEYVVSPNEQEVAFVIRGDIFVKRLQDPDSWAKRIASSAWREKQLHWSPDGSQLAFVSDRNQGQDAIFLVHAGKKHGVPLLLSQTLLPTVTKWTKETEQQSEYHPQWSPRGKELAFLRGRGTLVVRTYPEGKERVVVSHWNIGQFRWSPDGQWFIYSRIDDESNEDIFLVHASGQEPSFNVSRFPDEDGNPVWSANGRVIAFLSRGVNHRYGIRYAFLRRSDHEKSKVDQQRSCIRWAKQWKKRVVAQKKTALQERAQFIKAYLKTKRAKARQLQPHTVTTRPVQKHDPKNSISPQVRQRIARTRPTSRPSSGMKQPKTIPTGKPDGHIKIDFSDLPFRLRYLGGLPGQLGPVGLSISPEGCRFYIEVRDKNSGGLYEVSLSGKARRLASGSVSRTTVLPGGGLFFLRKGGHLHRLGKKGGRRPGVGQAGVPNVLPLRFSAELWIDREIEKMQLFTEAWSWLNHWFYDPQFHGVNWSALRKKYAKLLPYAHTRQDFDDIVHLLLGELNASHLGIYPPPSPDRDQTGDIGVQFDPEYNGPGLKVHAVRPKSPAAHRPNRIAVGDIVLAIDGHRLSAKTNVYAHLNHVLHRDVVLQVRRRDGKEETIALRPVSAMTARTQRYEAWVKQTRQRVEQWGGGLLGYAHIRSMGLPSLDTFERDLFAHAFGKQGLVLDLRFNGGGWTADYLLAMFFPQPHAFTRWRGSGQGYPVFRRPFYSWHKPIVLLINEKSGSNSEVFAHAFKNLKRGKIVGTPSFGGVISTRNIRLLDGSIFRIPLRGWWTLPGKVNMENNPAVPDVVVVHSPSEEGNHTDQQLLQAVRVLLQDLAGKP